MSEAIEKRLLAQSPLAKYHTLNNVGMTKINLVYQISLYV